MEQGYWHKAAANICLVPTTLLVSRLWQGQALMVRLWLNHILQNGWQHSLHKTTAVSNHFMTVQLS